MDCETSNFPQIAPTMKQDHIPHLGVRWMRVVFSCSPPTLPTEVWPLALTCSPFASSHSHYLMQGLYTCLWLTNISLNKRTLYSDILLFMIHTSTEKSRDFHLRQWGWHISSTCVCERVMWGAWFASLHSHPNSGITAGSCASALPINTFRTEPQAVFYVFKRKKNNRAFFHGPPLQEHWVMCPFFLNYCL